MSHIPANIRLQAGDTVNSLTGLKDCASGRCINLRLDGKAVAPEGWAAVCQPPPAKKFFQITNGYYRLRIGTVGHYQGEKNFRTLKEAQAALTAFLPAKAIEAKAALQSGQMGFNKTYAVGPYTGSHSDDDVVDASFRLEEKSCPPNNALAVCQTAAWPDDTCSEIIYQPAQGSFQPACAPHDPHLPEHLSNSRQCLSLCDAEGKRVRIRHTAAGIEIYQQKYQQAVLLDSKTLKVKALTANTTVPELAVTVNGQAAAGKRHKLTIGGHATLAANQAITVRADGKLVKQTPNGNGSVSLLGMAAGQLLVQVLTDCEGVELEFDVQASCLFKEDSFYNLIGKGEGGYHSVNLGEKYRYRSDTRNLTDMTINEILMRQENKEFNAAGKFQVVPETLIMAVKGLGLRRDEKFDEALQEKIGAWLFFRKRPPISDYIKGVSNNRDAAGDEAAKEWASFPILSSSISTPKGIVVRGESYYKYVGVNKAHHTPETLEAALDRSRSLYAEGKSQGLSDPEAEHYAFTGVKP